MAAMRHPNIVQARQWGCVLAQLLVPTERPVLFCISQAHVLGSTLSAPPSTWTLGRPVPDAH